LGEKTWRRLKALLMEKGACRPGSLASMAGVGGVGSGSCISAAGAEEQAVAAQQARA
jgi:hypothetical protein